MRFASFTHFQLLLVSHVDVQLLVSHTELYTAVISLNMVSKPELLLSDVESYFSNVAQQASQVEQLLSYFELLSVIC